MMTISHRPRAPYGLDASVTNCLYYPFFAIQNEDWAKKALLFWDSIATIVPKDVDLKTVGDATFHTLVSNGAVQPWAVSTEIRSEVADAALAMIDNGVHLQFPEGDPFVVNFGKLTPTLRQQLADRDLVRHSTQTELTLDRNVAFLILTLLAHRLAEATTAQPMTDDAELASCYIHVGHGQNRLTAALNILERDIRLAVPDIRNVDLNAWLRFREANRPALEAYRSGIRKLAREVSHATETGEVDEILSERQDEIAEKVAAKKRVLQTLTSDVTFTTLRLVVEIGSAPLNPGVAAALVGLEGIALGVKRLQRKELHHLSFVQKAAKKFAV